MPDKQTATKKYKGEDTLMRKILKAAIMAPFGGILLATMALADWNYSGPPSVPNAFIQTNNMSLELQCDRIRFSPAGYDSSQDIERKQGLSIRFMSNGSTEVGAFQAGASNASIGILTITRWRSSSPMQQTIRLCSTRLRQMRS